MSFGWSQKGQPSAMGALIAGHDWSKTPLGASDAWPAPLRSTLALCLSADFPVALWWGDTLVQFYNDPFCRAIGASRHASGFASPLAGAWPDIWPLLSPAVERIIGGEPVVRLHHLPLVETKAAENGHFALSLTPVQASDRAVGGILAVFHEAVPWKEVERSQGFLLTLCEALRRLRDPVGVAAAGCEMLGLHLGLERVSLAVLDADGVFGTLWPEWRRGMAAGLVKRFRTADWDAAAAASWEAGRAVFASGDAPKASSTAGPWEGEHRSAQVPLLEGGGLRALLSARAAAPRAWSRDDIDLMRSAGSAILYGLEQARLEAASKREAARFRAFVEGLPALLWRSAPDGDWTWSSPQWTQFTGLSAEDSLGEGWLAAFHPDDRPKLRAAWKEAGRTGSLLVEARIRNAADGRYRWFQTQAVPLRDGDGRPEWLGTSTDADEFHSVREAQARLLRDTQHRIHKTLAVIRSLARRGAEAAATVSEYAMHLDGRIDAFSRAQAITSGDAGGEVDLDFLVAEELDAHGAHEDGVIHIEGPRIRLRLPAAQTIGLAVHELVTHAVERGALLGNSGSIRIDWRVGDGLRGRELSFDWAERSGQAQEAPVAADPNFVVLEKVLAHEMNARLFLTDRGGEFTCRIVLPLGESAVEAEPS